MIWRHTSIAHGDECGECSGVILCACIGAKGLDPLELVLGSGLGLRSGREGERRGGKGRGAEHH
jgi:hypothetical protein